MTMTKAMRERYFARKLREKPPVQKRLPRLLYPERIEENYVRELRSMVRFLRERIEIHVKPLLPGLISHFGHRARKDAADQPRKYYLAFIYDQSYSKADLLHCTHHYLGELDAEGVKNVERIVDAYFLTDRQLPRVVFNQVEMFGPAGDVRVLTPEFASNAVKANFFLDLKCQLARVRPEDYDEYEPHVTTSLDKVDRPFSHYALISKAGIHRTWPKSVKLDEDSDLGDLADQLEKVRIEFNQTYSKDELERLANLTGESVATWNARQMNGQLKGIVEIDLFGDGGEPWLTRDLAAFTQQNVSLISSIGDEYTTQVERLIQSSVREGVLMGDLSDEIEERFGVAESRADLIARDQIGKFNGQLTEARQTDLGIDGYIWRDSGDARVRPEHHALNGEKFTWDDPPEPGHPGQDYQCRCSAEPDLASFFE